MTSSSLLINFSDLDACDYGIKFEYSPSPAEPGKQVKIKLYGASKEELDKTRLYYGSQDLGKGSFIKTESILSYRESIYFNEENLKLTKYPFNEIKSATASSELIIIEDDIITSFAPRGESINLHKEKDACVNIKEIVTGSIEVSYDAIKKYKTYNWTAPNVVVDTEFPFYVVREDHDPQEESILVSSETYDPVDVKLIIKDIANDRLISEADITITKENDIEFEPIIGKSDINGEFIANNLIPNQEYNLLVTKEGYIDSNLDYLNNDTFKVPVIEETEDE